MQVDSLADWMNVSNISAGVKKKKKKKNIALRMKNR